ncbi:hypothetical protein [Streptomyces sp. AC550_RSS872]|uniref:hypothetical protein n=1 Tax=Streptomyces sp. AC550_RSS872 TaxID=2823689 RepID=UPI0020B74024|nr:hypothetical protein [Streptomyces sp. AC550_RSS872]
MLIAPVALAPVALAPIALAPVAPIALTNPLRPAIAAGPAALPHRPAWAPP